MVLHPTLFLAIPTYVGFTRCRILLRPMMIVFHILPLLLGDCAFWMLLQIGSSFGAVERCWLEKSRARGVASNFGKRRKSTDLLRTEKRLHCRED